MEVHSGSFRCKAPAAETLSNQYEKVTLPPPGEPIFPRDLDFVIFLSDPLEPHPHDVDVKALLRIAVVYNIPVACNRATPDFIVSSPHMREEYRRLTMGIEGSTGALDPSHSHDVGYEPPPTLHV